jgi:hypothetical protein
MLTDSPKGSVVLSVLCALAVASDCNLRTLYSADPIVLLNGFSPMDWRIAECAHKRGSNQEISLSRRSLLVVIGRIVAN